MGSYMGTGQLGSALTHTVHTYTHAQLLERFVRTYPTEVLQYVALCLTNVGTQCFLSNGFARLQSWLMAMLSSGRSLSRSILGCEPLPRARGVVVPEAWCQGGAVAIRCLELGSRQSACRGRRSVRAAPGGAAFRMPRAACHVMREIAGP